MRTKIEWQEKVIEVRSRHIGIDLSPLGGVTRHHYAITVVSEGKFFKEDYWCIDSRLKVNQLREVLENLCMDATFGDLTIDEFFSDLGYKKISSCIKAYEGCKRILKGFKDMYIDPERLGKYLREKYSI